MLRNMHGTISPGYRRMWPKTARSATPTPPLAFGKLCVQSVYVLLVAALACIWVILRHRSNTLHKTNNKRVTRTTTTGTLRTPAHSLTLRKGKKALKCLQKVLIVSRISEKATGLQSFPIKLSELG